MPSCGATGSWERKFSARLSRYPSPEPARYASVMLTGTGQPSTPWNAMSSTRLRLKVTVLITANPSMFGAMTRARPNGSLVTIAAITAVNRSPRRALLSARDDLATGMRLSLAAAGARQQHALGPESREAGGLGPAEA